MAQTVEEHDFHAKHGNTKYPWDQWGDGRVWELAHGEDFEVEPDVMRGQVIVRARKEGRRVKTNVVKAADGKPATVVFQFLPAEEPATA